MGEQTTPSDNLGSRTLSGALKACDQVRLPWNAAPNTSGDHRCGGLVGQDRLILGPYYDFEWVEIAGRPFSTRFDTNPVRRTQAPKSSLKRLSVITLRHCAVASHW